MKEDLNEIKEVLEILKKIDPDSKVFKKSIDEIEKNLKEDMKDYEENKNKIIK